MIALAQVHLTDRHLLVVSARAFLLNQVLPSSSPKATEASAAPLPFLGIPIAGAVSVKP